MGEESIRVVCGKCKRGIKAPAKYAGKSAKCPGCGSPIRIPSGASSPPLPPVATKACPSCAETIKAVATKCRFCGHRPGDPLIDTDVPNRVDGGTCPFCFEKIKPGARKCCHCNELLDKDLIRKAERANAPNAGLAMLFSLIIPGAGQLYKGQFISGVFWFLAVIIGYAMMIVPGIFLHVFCVLGAGYEGISRK